VEHSHRAGRKKETQSPYIFLQSDREGEEGDEKKRECAYAEDVREKKKGEGRHDSGFHFVQREEKRKLKGGQTLG